MSGAHLLIGFGVFELNLFSPAIPCLSFPGPFGVVSYAIRGAYQIYTIHSPVGCS